VANKQLVLALFDNEAAADAAVSSLKAWDKATKEIKLGGIGVLVKDPAGKVKTQKLGGRKTVTGVVVGVIAGILTGGLSLLGGAIAGGIVGSFFRQGLGITKDDLARLDGELNGGKAAVAVMADPGEAPAVSAKLAELGGKPETHEVTEAAVAQATEAVEVAPAAEAAPEHPDMQAPEHPDMQAPGSAPTA
jgi:uncharacterized membrane protein